MGILRNERFCNSSQLMVNAATSIMLNRLISHLEIKFSKPEHNYLFGTENKKGIDQIWSNQCLLIINRPCPAAEMQYHVV